MNKILIHEVGLRDGLQAEKSSVPLDEKIRWIELARTSGIDIIQLGSFVNPEKMPQMADTDPCSGISPATNWRSRRRLYTVLSGLVLNEKGLERGLACGVEMFCMGVSASDTHSQKNTGMTTDEALRRIIPMARAPWKPGNVCRSRSSRRSAAASKVRCPKSGCWASCRLPGGRACATSAWPTPPGTPSRGRWKITSQQFIAWSPRWNCACHFHNTYGLGLANCYAALQSGVTYFEAAFGGLGGCPFTKVPAGNVSTEDLVHSFQRMGLRSDIRLDRLLELARQVEAYFGRELPGMILKSGSLV